MSAPSDPAGRFDRQQRFALLGADGQARLTSASATVVGCGALGGSIAQTLARVGIGRLVIVDRDVVELSNLPRQVLFSERHALESMPKALAAAEALAAIGGPTRVDARVAHADADNVDELCGAADLILDGTDNLATRYLINDFAVARGIPWIYGGVVAASGLVMPVIPGVGACLRCLFPEPAPPGTLATCDTAGVILPAVSAVAAWQCALAMRWLGGDASARAAFEPRIVELDPWTGETRSLPATRDPSCPCCGAREFAFLHGSLADQTTVLCGRNTVQVRPARARVDLERVERSLATLARDVRRAGSLLRFDVDGCRVTLFADGRALVEGTDDPVRARAVYDRWIGS